MLLLGSVASSLHAQEFRATIIGTVADPSGAAVPKASITVTEINTGAVSEPTSDGAGQDNIPFLPPGEYRMEVQAEGFSSLVRDHVTLEAGGTPPSISVSPSVNRARPSRSR